MVNVPEVGGVEKRLLAIPLLFIFLRIWRTVQFFFSLGVSGTNNNGCIPNNIHLGFFILGCLEVRIYAVLSFKVDIDSSVVPVALSITSIYSVDYGALIVTVTVTI